VVLKAYFSGVFSVWTVHSVGKITPYSVRTGASYGRNSCAKIAGAPVRTSIGERDSAWTGRYKERESLLVSEYHGLRPS